MAKAQALGAYSLWFSTIIIFLYLTDYGQDVLMVFNKVSIND